MLTSYVRFMIKNMWFQIYTYHILVELNLLHLWIASESKESKKKKFYNQI